MGGLVFLLAVLGTSSSAAVALPPRRWSARIQPVAAALIVVAGVLLIYDGASHFFDALILSH
jgi:cytochrome c biogenesis protein CcdA